MARPFKLIWVLLLLIILPNPTFLQLDELYYNGFSGLGADNITLNGVATILNNGILCLTNDNGRAIGRAFHPSPLHFSNFSYFSFSTTFVFAIVPEYPKFSGHGLAFTISPSKELPGASPDRYLGLLNASNVGNFTNHSFAVEFDDINNNHIGTDINNLQSNASAPVPHFDDEAVKHNINLTSGDRIQAWIDYDGVKKLLNVTVSLFSSSKPRLPILSFPLDLSPILQNHTMYVGFSASTGSHYLFGWSFTTEVTARSLDLSSLPSLPHLNKKKNTAFIVVASIAAVLLAVISVTVAVYLFRKIKNADVIEPWELEYGPHRFSYKELKTATKGFHNKELLGFGGFGRVYTGTLPKSKTQVAVKRVSHESRQGMREFLAEIASIGRLRHRNLVQLQGWCRRRGDLMLVYDFMCNGSLDKYLFDGPRLILSWNQRFKIIKCVASALLYLHEEWEQVVVHRDVKASNILLDGEMNGRLGDFGLARLYEHGSNTNTTHVMGTLGYLAPELTRTGKPTTAADVYAFGAVLLEVACGRRPIEPLAVLEEMVLVDWVWERWGVGRVMEVVDGRMGGDYDVEEVEMVLKLGLMCSHPVADERPSMRVVVKYLDGKGRPLEVSKLDYDGGIGMDGFDDFLHSYPSSMEKPDENSFAATDTQSISFAGSALAHGQWCSWAGTAGADPSPACFSVGLDM